MPRTARRSRCAPSVEALEFRAMLSTLSLPGSPEPGGSALVDSSRTMLIRVSEGVSQAAVQGIYRSLGAQVLKTYRDGPSLLQFSSQAARDSAVTTLGIRPWVVYAEADAPLVRSNLPRVVPNDPSFSSLWGLDNANDRDINAPEAWAVARSGGESVVVAVIDSGIDLSHPDLVNRLWVNPGERANGTDSDGNGFVDDVHGWNFVSKSGDVSDDNGHGTHVAGTIAAGFNNGVGVAGVAWASEIMTLKVLDSQGNGLTSDAVRAIYYAADHGARVINASWGGPGYSQALADAIRAVGRPDPATGYQGAVFVTAAGNDSANNDVRPSYPSNNRFAHTITVAAIDESGNLASYSNFGSKTVDVAAPGDRILSTIPGGYGLYSGTSMATPHVAGTVALAAAQFPGLTAAELAQLVVSKARPMASLAGKVTSGGLVDAFATVSSSTSQPTPTPPPSQPAPPPSQPTPAPSPTPPSTPAPAPAPPESAGIDPLPLYPVPISGSLNEPLLRATLISSDEFYRNVGGTPELYLTRLYQLVLNRAPEASGLSFWAAKLRSGVSRLDVALGITSSFEANQVKVAGWYRSDLGRTSSIAELKSDPGVNQWASQLTSGVRPDAVRASILNSTEFISRQGGTLEGLVVGVYRTLLNRDPNNATRAAAAAQLRIGEWNALTLVESVQSIEEAARTKVAAWYRSDLGRTSSIAALKSDSGVIYWAKLLPRA